MEKVDTEALVDRIIEETHLKPSLVRLVVKMMIHDIRQDIIDGKEVELEGLCTFTQYESDAKLCMSRLLDTGYPEPYSLSPARRVCKVKLYSPLNDYIKRSTAHITDRFRQIQEEHPGIPISVHFTHNPFSASALGVPCTNRPSITATQLYWHDVLDRREDALQDNLEFLRDMNDRRYSEPDTPKKRRNSASSGQDES